MTSKGRGDKPKSGVPAGRRRLTVKKETLRDLGPKKDGKIRGGLESIGCIVKTIACGITLRGCF